MLPAALRRCSRLPASSPLRCLRAPTPVRQISLLPSTATESHHLFNHQTKRHQQAAAATAAAVQHDESSNNIAGARFNDQQVNASLGGLDSDGTTSTSSDKPIAKSSVRVTVANTSGSLQDILKFFWKHDINMTRIESRPNKQSATDYDIYVDFDGSVDDSRVKSLLQALKQHSVDVQMQQSKRVHWWPRRLAELDSVASQVLDAGVDLQSDHPGFSDPQYRARRKQLSDISASYRQGQQIPRIDYNENEKATWRTIYNKLYPLLQQHACIEYKRLFPLLQQNCGYSADTVSSVPMLDWQFLAHKLATNDLSPCAAISCRSHNYKTFLIFSKTPQAFRSALLQASSPPVTSSTA